MHNTHPSIIDQNSRLLSQSAKLSCMLNDISTKLESITTQSAPEQVIWVWEIASSGVRRAGRNKFNNSHAAARGSRAEGRIIQRLNHLCEGVFNPVTNIRIHPKQRAGRWRAAYPLTDGDGWINARDPDSGNDGLTDGTEMGRTEPVSGMGAGVKGIDNYSLI